MLLELQKKVSKIPDDFVLLKPSRIILRYDKLMEVTPKTRDMAFNPKKALRVVLCNDCLLILSKSYE